MRIDTQAVRYAIENDREGVINQIASRQAENLQILDAESLAKVIRQGLPSLDGMTDNQLVCEYIMTFDEGGADND